MPPTLRTRLVKAGFVAGLQAMRRAQGGPPPLDGPEEALQEFALELRDQVERLASRTPLGRTVRVRRVDTHAPVDGLWVADARARTRDTDEPAGLSDRPGERVEDAERVVLHLHGGAYLLGSPETHRGLAAAISRTARAPVLLPRYRLAPQHVFPAAADDAVDAYRWLVEDRGVPPHRIAVSGDSAGGGLALNMLVRAREEGLPLPACYVGLSPWTDLAGTGPSLRELDHLDPWLSAELVLPAARAVAGDLPLDDPSVSPLYADLHGLPPMLVHVGSDEILLDDARRIVERAREAGVDASLGTFDGLWHVFQVFPLPESRRSLREVGAFIRRHTTETTEQAA